MLDYSIGHEILLLNQRNPLACLSGEEFDKLPSNEQRIAIIRAALVCSQTWAQNLKPHKWLRLWGWLIRNQDFALAVADFRNYRWAGSSFPILKKLDDSEAGRAFGSPLFARLLNFIGGNYDHPLGLAQWLYFAALEGDGKIHVENEMEQSIREQEAKHIADILREQEERKSCPR